MGGGYERVPVLNLERLEQAVADLQAVYPQSDAARASNGGGDTHDVLERVVALETAVAEIRDSLPPGFLRRS